MIILEREGGKKLYKHDCNACVFLGNGMATRNMPLSDLYYCEVDGNFTLVERYSSIQHDYYSLSNLNFYRVVPDYALRVLDALQSLQLLTPKRLGKLYNLPE